MLTNWLNITLRSLYREKVYVIINISGLSFALACCLILGLWLHSELTYDRHNIRYKQIFRIETETTWNGNTNSTSLTTKSLGPLLAEEYPEIKGFVRFQPNGNNLISHGDKVFEWEHIYNADANIFEVFTHEIIYGDPESALLDPTSAAVSESFAKKYFNDSNPIGETVSNDESTYKITLVFADLPENTHLKYNMLLSYNAESDNVTQSNQNLQRVITNVYTYLLLPEGYDIRVFKDIFASFYARHLTGQRLAMRSWLQPLEDIYLHSDVKDGLSSGNKLYLYAFTAVALFILLVACINYINLATARATKRAKEVGMRKILGAGRIGLMLHFLGESILLTLIAMFFGLILAELALNLTPINELLNKHLTLDLIHEPGLSGWMFAFTLVVGLMSGLYPALYLSSMPPLSALVRSYRAGKGSIRLRELLVFLQFIISVSVVACTLLMALQMRYVSHKSLGFDKENRVIVTLRGADLIDKIPTIKKELSKNSSILGISGSDTMIGHGTPEFISMIENDDGVLENTTLKNMMVGDDFLEVMGMQLLKGRDFSRKLLTDVGTAFIVNETMVKKMGREEPLGKRIQTGMYTGRVIGVVKDFHYTSLHRQVEPVVLYQSANKTQNIPFEMRQSMRYFLFLHISGEDMPGTLAFLGNKFSEFDPKHPFQYEFLDDSMDQLYLSEQRAMKLIGIFAGVCIFISCLGLFGLTAFTTELRTREIGTRKVLGASTWQIIIMLSRRILLLVLAGAVIASLIAFFAMDEWLSMFAYRIGINPLVFLSSAIVAAMVAFITVALQSYRTASANPVKALRYE